jgi:hypothetical protein
MRVIINGVVAGLAEHPRLAYLSQHRDSYKPRQVRQILGGNKRTSLEFLRLHITML